MSCSLKKILHTPICNKQKHLKLIHIMVFFRFWWSKDNL